MDFGAIINNLKNSARKWIAPDEPPAPTPLQQGQSVSDFPGYEQPVAPPATVDFDAITSTLGDLGNGLGNFFSQFMPQGDAPAPVIPEMAPAVGGGYAAPAPTPAPDNLEEVIKRGLESYGKTNGLGTPPIATLSAQLAEAGHGQHDPLLPTINSLKETGGGFKQAHENNPLNIFDPRGKDYPNPESNIAGRKGDERWSFKELLDEGSAYGKYRDSGNLEDFFSVYAPVSDPRNPSIEEQMALYEDIKRRHFQ
jgi:hypothetical protein